MEWKYKSLIFLILLLFCMSSVCATEHNITDNVTTVNTDKNVTPVDNITDNVTPVDNITDNVTPVDNITDNVTPVDNITDNVTTVNTDKNVTEIEQLKEENNQLKTLIIVLIAENNELETLIEELIAENNKLEKISPKTPQVSKHFIKGAMKKINRYITKYGKNPKTVKYGNKSLKIKEFLNLKLVKNAKKSIIQFKAKKGRLPNYVDVNGVRIYKQNYRILFHI